MSIEMKLPSMKPLKNLKRFFLLPQINRNRCGLKLVRIVPQHTKPQLIKALLIDVKDVDLKYFIKKSYFGLK